VNAARRAIAAGAASYLELADGMLGGAWATPARLRNGTSRLLAEIRAAAGGRAASGG